MKVSGKSLFKVALLTFASASIVACSSKPKEEVVVPPPPPPVEAPRPVTPPPPPPPPPAQGVLPGSQQDFVVNVGDRVYFDLDQSSIRADARAILDAQAAWLVRYPSVKIRIEGNADERGTREYNYALGARRAEAVSQYLVSRGVLPNRISTISYGKENPIATGSNEESWSQNRNAKTTLTEGTR